MTFQGAAYTIYCIGRNYAKHIAELNNERPTEPVVFLKSPAAMRTLTSNEPMGFAGETYAYEAEIVIRVNKDYKLGAKLTWDDAEEYALGIDLTRREVQEVLKGKGLPWTTAKSFAGSSIVGPFVSIFDVEDKKEMSFEFKLRGELKQKASVKEMLWDIPSLMTYVNSFSPLRAGDLIFTGTPQGVGPIVAGDRFELSSPEIGKYEGQL